MGLPHLFLSLFPLSLLYCKHIHNVIQRTGDCLQSILYIPQGGVRYIKDHYTNHKKYHNSTSKLENKQLPF